MLHVYNSLIVTKNILIWCCFQFGVFACCNMSAILCILLKLGAETRGLPNTLHHQTQNPRPVLHPSWCILCLYSVWSELDLKGVWRKSEAKSHLTLNSSSILYVFPRYSQKFLTSLHSGQQPLCSTLVHFGCSLGHSGWSHTGPSSVHTHGQLECPG